ncbi:PREDICTED: protein MARD1-like [Tarenaya hassleriana]|uniref:protein MARD1-like n=1 Tax=Tarenaya hassleriana TaxID=28532 RepID=UPI00053C4EB6|nr:PREDICTED: protein MARD1-like [Tarenaya hassleriana]
MLKTRTSSLSQHKDQAAMSQFLDPKPEPPKTITNPLGLLIGLSKKDLSSYDSVRSPTSPLEFRVCSNLTEPFIRSPRSSWQNGHQFNCLGPAKVGLSIVDSLHNDQNLSRDVIFGAAVRIKTLKNQDKSPEFDHEPKSLSEGFPALQTTKEIKNATSGVIFEIGEDPFEPEPVGLKNRYFSWGSCRSLPTGSGLALCGTDSSSGSDCLRKTRVLSRSKLGEELSNSSHLLDLKPEPKSGSVVPDTGLLGSYSSANDIELLEDYTCIISHGPNPKTTHIYGDQILECHNNLNKGGFCGNKEDHIPTEPDSLFPSDDFLSFCYFCNKKLEDGKDIYMYRGEKAFCSVECRSEEMLMDEDLDVNLNMPEPPTRP